MIHSVYFMVVLDTNVIYPAVIRDLFFGLPIMIYIHRNGANIYLMNGLMWYSCH